MKKIKTFTSLMLICLLSLSYVSLTFGNYASAATGAANFLPNVFYDTTQNGFDTANEVQRSQNAAYYITSLLNSRYGSNNCYQRINASATKSGYTTTLNTLQTYDKAVVFSKGHRTIVGSQLGIIPNHTILHPHPDSYLLGPGISPYTSAKNVVTFIWHCQTADDYPGTGLPYSFTNNNNMGYYGSSGSQVYLGWTNRSPFYIQWPNGTVQLSPYPNGQVGSPQYEWKMTANNDFGRIAELYWYYMCQGQTYTSYSALNKISNDIYATGFMNGYLYHWLIIYGNQAMVLPY